MPENNYEWMLQEDLETQAQSQLPVDENAVLRQVIFITPVLLLIAITLLTSRKIHSKPWFVATIFFCIGILLAALVKAIF